MPHVFALPTAQRDALARLDGTPITIRVLMTANYRHVNSFQSGVPTFGTTYDTIQADLTDRLTGPISFSGARPIFPDGIESFYRGEMDIPLINTDEYISCLQSGAMVRMADIDQGTIQIDAIISGVTQPLTMFKGRIKGPPKEEFGLTTFTVFDTIWDAIKRPVLYEDFVNIAGSQTITTAAGRLIETHRRVDTLNGGHFCVYNGIVEWDAQGDVKIRYTNNKGGQIDIKSVTVSNEAKIGQYVIEFTDATQFSLTYPDNSVYKGNISTDTITPKVTLYARDWTSKDGTGCKITFGVGVCMKGNPVTIARNFIEKALLENWGFAPANTFQVKMDTAAWNAAERRFTTYTIYLSETNKDNIVWQRKRGSGNTPVNCLELAQKALDHVGCLLQMRQDGLISITTPFFDDRDIWTIDSNTILRATIESPTQWNYLTVQYGEENGSYSAIHEHDLRLTQTAEVNEKVVTMPYYKSGISRYRAGWLMETYVRRYWRRQQTITIDIVPQIALPMLCGDVVEIHTTEQPKVQLVCEVVSYSISINGTCRLELVPIQQYEGASFKICVARLANELLW